MLKNNVFHDNLRLIKITEEKSLKFHFQKADVKKNLHKNLKQELSLNTYIYFLCLDYLFLVLLVLNTTKKQAKFVFLLV